MSDAENSATGKGWLEALKGLVSPVPQTQKQLKQLLKKLHNQQLLGSEELFMIEGALQVSGMQVRDIMVPRGQMIVLQHSDGFDQIIKKITDSGHSRFPVIDDDRDDIVGILLAKDLLGLTSGQTQKFEFNDFIRPASFIPESKRLNVLLREFRLNHRHMAMIVDEYGGVSGLVTIEDVLEQIVGQIDDEHDDEEEIDINQHGNSRFSVRALTPLVSFNEYFNTEFDSENIETIGGYLLGEFGHLPMRDEKVTLQDLTFRVLSADSRRVYLYQVVDGREQEIAKN